MNFLDKIKPIVMGCVALIILLNFSDELKQSFKTHELRILTVSVPVAIAIAAVSSPLDLPVRTSMKIGESRKVGNILSFPGEELFLIPFLLGGYAIGTISNSREIRVTFLRSAISLGITTAVVQTLKFVGRHRPYCSPENQWVFSPPGIHDSNRSFPSGHSQASAAVFFSISRICGRNAPCRMFFASVPFVVALGRIMSDEHWLSDAIGGIIIGGSFELFRL